MKTLIAYYSRTGANERLAQELQKKLTLRLKVEHASKKVPPSVCDIEKIEDVKGYGGPLGLIRGGRDAKNKKTGEIKPVQKDPSDYTMVVIAGPLWAGLIPPAIRAYISQNKSKLKSVAFASVSGGGEGNKNALPDFEMLLGKKPMASMLLSGKEFQSASEERIEDFAKKLAAHSG